MDGLPAQWRGRGRGRGMDERVYDSVEGVGLMNGFIFVWKRGSI